MQLAGAEDATLAETVASLHARFEQTHRLLAGNGRTGRPVLNLVPVRLGSPPATSRPTRYESPPSTAASRPQKRPTAPGEAHRPGFRNTSTAATSASHATFLKPFRVRPDRIKQKGPGFQGLSIAGAGFEPATFGL